MDTQITIEPVSLDEFVTWINGILAQIYHFIQYASPPFFMVLFALGAIMLVVGALFGASRIRGAGVATLLLGAIAFLIINNAEAVVGVLESFADRGP